MKAGRNYQGEVEGWIYDPWTDKYYIDPRARQQWLERQGLAKEKPSKGDETAAGLLGLGGQVGGLYLGGKIPGWLSGASTDATAATTGGGSGVGSAGAGGASASSGAAAEAGSTAAAGAEGAAVPTSSWGAYAGPAAAAAMGAYQTSEWLDRVLNDRETKGAKDWTNRLYTAGVSGGVSEAAQALHDTSKSFLRGEDPNTAEGWAGRGLLALGTFGASEALRPMLKASGKDRDQQMRDVVRNQLQYLNFSDDNDLVTLADGSTFDIGKDGGATFVGKDNQSYKSGYESDWSNALTGASVNKAGLLNALASGEDNVWAADQKKAPRNLTAQLNNAIISNAADEAGVNANARAILDKSKLGGLLAWNRIGDLVNAGKISSEAGTSYHNALKDIYGQDTVESWFKNPTQSQQQPQSQQQLGGFLGNYGQMQNAMYMVPPERQQEYANVLRQWGQNTGGGYLK